MITTPPAPAPATTTRRIVRFELAPRTILAVIVTVAAIWMLTRLVPVMLALVAALMIVGALNPLVRALQKRRLSRMRAIALVLGSAVLLTVAVLFLTVPALIDQLRSFAENEPQIRARAVAYLSESPLTRTLAAQLKDVDYSDLLKDSHTTVLSASLRAIEVAAYAVAAVFLALYIMIDEARLRGALFAVVPRRHHVRFSRVLVNLETIVGGYIRGQVITCVLIGVFILALLLICHVPNALALAVFGAIADVLPYVGPFLTIIPAVAAAYTVSPAVAVTVLVLLLAYEEFEARILIPLVYGRALRLPSSVVFFALLLGAALDGVVGALLALPIASAALMVIEELRVDLPGATELPEVEAARARDEQEAKQYERMTEEAPVVEASAVAVEIARERKEEEEDGASASEEKK